MPNRSRSKASPSRCPVEAAWRAKSVLASTRARRRVTRLGGQLQPCPQARGRAVRELDVTTMFSRDVPADRKAQADAARIPVSGLFKPVKWSEDSLLLVNGNTGTVVIHDDHHAVRFPDEFDARTATILDGIFDQIGD